MSSSPALLRIELEVDRIRDISKEGRHREALAAAEALAVVAPENRDVLYLIAANQRCLHRIPEALATLQRLQQSHPRFSLLYQERGYCYVTLQDAPRAIDAFLRGVDLNPALEASWIMLDRLYRVTGQAGYAAAASEHISALKQLPPEVVRAGSLFSNGNLSAAANILRAYLVTAKHVDALRLLAQVVRRQGKLDEAELLFEAALELAPGHKTARSDYVRVLIDRQKYSLACEMLHALLRNEPGNRDYLFLHATACAGRGQHDRAIIAYRQLLAASGESAELDVLLGHSLKSVGQQKEAIEAYQTAAAVRPGFGDAYWSLANLKTYRFSLDEISRMRAEEASSHDRPVDRYHLCFALGKAYEDWNEYAESWQFYERGNRLKRSQVCYDPEIVEASIRSQIEVCTARFFAARAGVGAADAAPIFILGLPRSGSTLLEQILASHSQVEATHELYDVQRIALDVRRLPDKDYSGVLTEIDPLEFRRHGERYINDTRAYREGKPFFIDKMPNNFRHIGLIHLMLPNAKIIDVRREPMACCFSNWKQLFASGQEFAYSMADLARYYRLYLELMWHWDTVLPGRVFRIWHEDIVEDLEGSVRRILEYCSLEFEPACVEFYKTERGISTPSSEQVRRPIFREGLRQWRNYEPWLFPLKDDLGDALVRYRDRAQ